VTLVEVLVASLVLVIGVLGTLAAFPQAFGTAHRSSHMLVLNQLANEKLDSLRALDLDDADLSVGVHPVQGFDSNGDLYYPVPGFSDDYSLRWTVQAGPTDSSGTPEANMRTVVVEVTYWVRYTAGGLPIENDGSLGTRFQTYVARD